MMVTVAGEQTYCYTGNRTPDPDRPSAILLHGAGLDHTVWTLVARHFVRHGRARVLVFDLPDRPSHRGFRGFLRWPGFALGTLPDVRALLCLQGHVV